MSDHLGRRLVSEVLGTAFLLATVIGSGVMAFKLAGGNGAIALLCNTIPTGAILAVMILIFGPVSGAHFNPAVSVAFGLRRELDWRTVGLYVAAQVIGAIAGVWAAHLMFELPIWQSATTARTGLGQWFAEAIATFGLLLTIFGCLARTPAAIPYAVGLYITAAYWFTASTSFANPAVTIARALSDTYAGIAPGGVLAFILAQLGGMVAAVALAGHTVRMSPTGTLTSSSHLAQWLTNPPAWLSGPIVGAIVIIGLSFVGHQMLSWRRAGGDRRQQLKWLACGGAVAAVSLILAVSHGVWFLAGLAALPVGIGVGILRYRLYDIDRIISRTLAYALVTGVLVGVYAGLVLLATKVLSVHSTVAVAAATLAAAALFNPLRRRVQNIVDRRFNRARYNADRIVAGFASRLQGTVDLDAVRVDLASSVKQTLEPAHISVWIRAEGRQ